MNFMEWAPLTNFHNKSTPMKSPPSKRFKTCLACTIISLLVLGASWIAESVCGLVPCSLCLWQRAVWVGILLVGVTGLCIKRHLVAVVAIGMLALVGTTVASYHLAVVKGLVGSRCSKGKPTSQNDFRQMLIEPKPPIDKSLALFGIHAAGWNAGVSLIVALVCVQSVFLPRKIPEPLPD